MSDMASSSPNPVRINILGVNISAINMAMAVNTIENWIAHCDQHYVCVTPAHGVMECQGNAELRQIFNSSGLTTPDGMGIVWLLKLKGQRHVDRVYGPDLMLAICERSLNCGWRHFFYGGSTQVVEELAQRLQARFPGLNVLGTYSPPFRPLTDEEDRLLIKQINALEPDIVWTGISTPKQERWMADHIGRIKAPVFIGVGAAFDFLSGHKRQAPKWVQRAGLEWLFRLVNEPNRLWRRYIQYPLFILLVLAQTLRIKRFPIE